MLRPMRPKPLIPTLIGIVPPLQGERLRLCQKSATT